MTPQMDVIHGVERAGMHAGVCVEQVWFRELYRGQSEREGPILVSSTDDYFFEIEPWHPPILRKAIILHSLYIETDAGLHYFAIALKHISGGDLSICKALLIEADMLQEDS